MQRRSNPIRGFSLLELMIAASVGVFLVGTAVKLYSIGLTMSWQTSQKAQLQQDFRAAANLLERDLSMAGSGALGQQGLSNGSVGLPTGNGSTIPVYPCTALTTCNYIKSAPVAYPDSPTGAPSLYSIMPGPSLGITVTAAAGPTDIITVNYADAGLPLNCYTGTVNAAATAVTFILPSNWSQTCVTPPNIVPPALPPSLIYNSTGNTVGLQVGDMIMFGTNALGVVTGAASTCGVVAPNLACYQVPFATGDPGHVNQPGVATGSLLQYAGAAVPSAVRLISVTYYLAIPASTGLPTLMRIQNGQPPAPVAENVVYLKFTYDVINSSGTVTANQATLPAGTTPSMITKINIAHMSMRSQGRDTSSKSSLSGYGYESLDLQTSLAARSLTSQQQYPITVTN
jgi:type II secretory pathway pseudopilin PulG